MSDPLAPARGILLGCLLGAALWAAAITLGIGIYLAAWQVMP